MRICDSTHKIKRPSEITTRIGWENKFRMFSLNAIDSYPKWKRRTILQYCFDKRKDEATYSVHFCWHPMVSETKYLAKIMKKSTFCWAMQHTPLMVVVTSLLVSWNQLFCCHLKKTLVLNDAIWVLAWSLAAKKPILVDKRMSRDPQYKVLCSLFILSS